MRVRERLMLTAQDTAQAWLTPGLCPSLSSFPHGRLPPQPLCGSPSHLPTPHLSTLILSVTQPTEEACFPLPASCDTPTHCWGRGGTGKKGGTKIKHLVLNWKLPCDPPGISM